MIGIILLGVIDKNQNKIVEYILNQLNEFIDDKIFIDLYKGNKLYKLINEKVKIRKIILDEFDNWNDIESEIKNKLCDIDTLIIFKSVMMSGFKNGDNSLVDNFLKEYKKNNKYCINYISIRKILEKCMLIKVASEMNKKIIQLSIDPQEIDFRDSFNFESYKRYFILKRGDNKYAPFYEYKMNMDLKNETINKNINLFFIGSVQTRDRYFLYNIKERLENVKQITFKVFDKNDNKQNRITQDEYYRFLSKSKYTIICKPYENNSFSIIRFFEAICCNCIPLILDDVCLDEIEATFKDIYDIIIKYNIIINIDNIEDRIKKYDNDKDIVEEIKRSKSFKKITNYNKVKNFYNKLVN